jgi:hypothetical protein
MTEPTELREEDLEGRPSAFSAESWTTQRRLAEEQADRVRAGDLEDVAELERANRDANRVLALLAGLVALAGPRRTRPLAAFLYGAFLSRVAGHGRRRLEAELLRLFDERTSVGARVAELEARHGRAHIGAGRMFEELDERLADCEAYAVGVDTDDHLRVIARIQERVRRRAEERG